MPYASVDLGGLGPAIVERMVRVRADRDQAI